MRLQTPVPSQQKVFEATYGTQEELFAMTNRLIGYSDEMVAAMSAREIKPETGLRQRAPKKPRKTPVIKPKVAPPVVKFVANAKRTIPVPKKIPSRPLQNAKLPKPSPEMLARQKAAQKASRERYLKENASRIEAVKRKAREKAVEVRRLLGNEVLRVRRQDWSRARLWRDNLVFCIDIMCALTVSWDYEQAINHSFRHHCRDPRQCG